MQNVEYRIKRDVDGQWCIKGYLSTGQEMATVYCTDTAALIEALMMLDGSGFCPPADDGPNNLEIAV
jgi:hypothetical protein